MTEKALDKEFSKLIQNIQQNANTHQNLSECELKKTFPDFKSPLLNQPTDSLCKIDNLTYQCKPNNQLDEFYNVVNSSKNTIKSIPEQLVDNNYDNIYINKTFQPKQNTCRFRGTNQQFNLSDDKADPNMSVDSDGYCILKGANIG